MNNIQLFAKTLNQLGMELDSSKYDENSFYKKESFSCPSTNSDDQKPVELVVMVGVASLHLSLCHAGFIILRPFNSKVEWSELSESQVVSLANEYYSIYCALNSKACALMSGI